MARWKSFVLGAAALAALLALGGLLVVFTGGYDIAADQPHTGLGAWALRTNFANALERQADAIDAPELTPAMVAAGAPHYKAMCAHCHGGVGAGRAEWAEGMSPRPPALAKAAKELSAPQVFWLVKHGVRMTAMPAFGDTHDDQTIWAIAAFVKALPTMSAAQYSAYPAEHEHGGEEGHSHESGEAHHHHHH